MPNVKQLADTPLKLAMVAGVGMFLSTLDSGIINIAVPTLLKYFNTHISVVIWTITLYTLVLSATILLFGRLADQFGRLRVAGKAMPEFYSFGIITVIFISVYLWSEKKDEHPIIPLQLFKAMNFTSPMLGIIAFGGATAVAFILPPLYLEKLRYFQAWQVGLISFSAPLGLVFSSRISARLKGKHWLKNQLGF